MLESFRKYTGLMFVVLILLFLGLVFFGTGQSGFMTGQKVLEAHGRGFTQPERQRMAESPARMLRQMAGYPGSQSYGAIDPYLRRMGVIAWAQYPLTRDQVNDYLVNRVTMQKAMDEFGIYPSKTDAEQFLREKIFVNPDGTPDGAAYDEFVEKKLPSYGMGVKDMNDVIREVIAIGRLEELMSAGIEASPDAVTADYMTAQQRIDYKLVPFQLATFEAKEDPTEEEVKDYWEKNKTKYLSDEERRITYILARPDYAKLEEEKKAKADETKAGTEDEASAEKEEKAEGEEIAEAEEEKPAPPADAALTAEEREQAVVAEGARLDALWDLLQTSEGEDFEKLGKENNFEVLKTELVKQADLPPELNGPLRDAPGKKGSDVIFEHKMSDNLWDATSDVRRLGADQWMLYQIDEVVAPKELDYATAKDEARLDLVKERADKAMKAAAREKQKALVEAMEGGKSFEDAAKELELTPISRTGVMRARQRGAPQVEFDLASRTNPGNVSEVEDHEDERLGIKRSFLVYVDKREIPDDAGLQTRIDATVSETTNNLRSIVLDTWFEQQKIAANVKDPFAEENAP